MYRFINIRNGAIAALVVTLILCFLATSSFAVTVIPINGNKKMCDPDPTPYWDMGEPGSHPGLGIDALSSSGACIDPVDATRINYTPASYNDIEFVEILKIILFRISFSVLNHLSYNNIWSQ